MIMIDIYKFDYKTQLSIYSKLDFIIKNNNANLPKFLLNNDGNNEDNNIIKKDIYINDILGEGSYGIVFKIKIDEKYYALKISENEDPDKLINRYKSLCQNHKLAKHIIKIYCCGRILKTKKNYKYYCIMEYGGDTLKSVINSFNIYELNFILKQLYNIIYQSTKFRLLITDFKLGNLTITNKNKIKIIDIYMECQNYSPCVDCRIVKTYSTIELEKEKRIYENPNYNFTAIYIPLAISLIDLMCEKTFSYYIDKICKKFELNLSTKQCVPLLQISCYNFNNSNNDSIKKYKNIETFKKNIEKEFKILKNNSFYEFFITLLQPKQKYADSINIKLLFNTINELLTVDPNQRSLKSFKELINIIDNKNNTTFS